MSLFMQLNCEVVDNGDGVGPITRFQTELGRFKVLRPRWLDSFNFECLWCLAPFCVVSTSIVEGVTHKLGLIKGIWCHCAEAAAHRIEAFERQQVAKEAAARAAEIRRQVALEVAQQVAIEVAAERAEREALAAQTGAMEAIFAAANTSWQGLPPQPIQPASQTSISHLPDYAEMCARWYRYQRGAAGDDYDACKLRDGEPWDRAAARFAYNPQSWQLSHHKLQHLDSYWNGPTATKWAEVFETFMRGQGCTLGKSAKVVVVVAKSTEKSTGLPTGLSKLESLDDGEVEKKVNHLPKGFRRLEF